MKLSSHKFPKLKIGHFLVGDFLPYLGPQELLFVSEDWTLKHLVQLFNNGIGFLRFEVFFYFSGNVLCFSPSSLAWTPLILELCRKFKMYDFWTAKNCLILNIGKINISCSEAGVNNENESESKEKWPKKNHLLCWKLAFSFVWICLSCKNDKILSHDGIPSHVLIHRWKYIQSDFLQSWLCDTTLYIHQFQFQ